MIINNRLLTFNRLVCIIVSSLVIGILACGTEPVAEVPEKVVPTVVEQPASEPTNIPVPTLEPTTPGATETKYPTETSEPTPTPIRKTTISEYGFLLNLDGEIAVQSGGWSESEADQNQGLLRFPYQGVSAILVWYPSENTPQQVVIDSYQLLRDNQPDLTFEAISDGAIPVAGETGVFGGFKVLKGSDTVGGGFVAGWICSESQSRYALTVTGSQATVVQIRFQRIVNQFACGS